jgi:hypothetical protein
MPGANTIKLAEFQALLKERDSKIKLLEEELQLKTLELESLKDQEPKPFIPANLGKFSQEFDIEGMSVFAIEYNYETQKTVIGYKVASTGKVDAEEWAFHTSFKQHERLVKRFLKKIKH